MVYKIHTTFQNIFFSVITLKFGRQAGLKKLAKGLDEQFSYWALGRVITIISFLIIKLNLIQDTFELTGLILFRTMAIDRATICFPIKTKFSGYIQAILCTT